MAQNMTPEEIAALAAAVTTAQAQAQAEQQRIAATTKVPGRLTLTRLTVLPWVWLYYAVLVLPVQAAWYLFKRYALKDATATAPKVWKPNFRKQTTLAEVQAKAQGKQQPKTITDIIMLFLFGWWYALLRIIRK